MKKIFLLLILVLISCETTNKQEPQTQLDFPFEPSYQKDWKMGNQENVLLIQNLHKILLDGEFDRVTEFISDTIVMSMGDGSRVSGIDNFKELLEGYKDANLRDYNLGVNFPIISEEGHEWVINWDAVTYDTADGPLRMRYQEAYRISGGKIVFVNQFTKPVLD